MARTGFELPILSLVDRENENQKSGSNIFVVRSLSTRRYKKLFFYQANERHTMQKKNPAWCKHFYVED